jgi:hypothetical protein
VGLATRDIPGVARERIVPPEPAASPSRGRYGLEEPTDTLRANQMFLARVQQIPGLLGVERVGGATLGEQSFKVYVADRFSDAGRAVRALEDEVIRAYPEARFDVWLTEAPPPAQDADGAGR